MPDDSGLGVTADDLDGLPVRWISHDFACQIHPDLEPQELLAVAANAGLYHRGGEPHPLYLAENEYIALCEVLCQFSRDDDPGRNEDLEVIASQHARHIGTARVRGLPVLDLTDHDVRRKLPVTEEQLTSDGRVCQAIARLVRSRPDRFGGILAPSVPIRGAQILVVFYDRIRDHVILTRPDPRSDDGGTALARELPTDVAAPDRHMQVAADRTLGRAERWLATTTFAQAVIAVTGAMMALGGLIVALIKAIQ